MLIPTQKPIPATLFGLHIHRVASTTPWPPVNFNSWSLIDAHATWQNLQPVKERWDFSKLDKYVLLAKEKNVDLLLPLAFTPQWASARPSETGPYGPGTGAEPLQMDDWRAYVRAVGERYKGRIKYFQVWDEPNEKAYFSGSKEKLLDLISVASGILKGVDPESRMISPGVVGASGIDWLENYFGRGGASYTDIVGFHFYPPVGGPDQAAQQPESMIPLAQKVKEVMASHGLSGKPLWNTGIGYWNVNGDGTPANMAGVDARWIRLDQDRAAAWVARTFILGWALGMERVFWYSWDHLNMGLVEPSAKVLKPAGRAYQTTFNWLVDSTMTYCRSDDGSLWVCELKRGARTAWLVWRTTGEMKMDLPPVWQAREFQTLLGNTVQLPPGTETITIGEQPVLVKADTKPW